MITRITGNLARLTTQAAYLEIGAYEHEVFIPETARRSLQSTAEGESVSMHTIEFIDGNAAKGGRLTPRMIGFLSPIEREFFEMFCSVDGLGVKKALAAMNRPVADIAAAIEDRDTRTLTTLPGIGPAVADRIVAKLSRKMAKFALLIQAEASTRAPVERDVANDTFEVLVSLGHSPSDATELVKQAAEALGRKKKTVEAMLDEAFRIQRSLGA